MRLELSCGGAFLQNATRVTDEDVDRLRSLGLADAEILDVVLAAAARCFFSKVLDGVGAEPDAKYASLDSGLRDALETLAGVEGATVVTFTDADVVRHPMVARIVRAYNALDNRLDNGTTR